RGCRAFFRIQAREVRAVIRLRGAVRQQLEAGEGHGEQAWQGPSAGRDDEPGPAAAPDLVMIELERVDQGAETVAAPVHLAEAPLQAKVKRVRVGEQLEAARILDELSENARERRRDRGIGGAGLRAGGWAGNCGRGAL